MKFCRAVSRPFQLSSTLCTQAGSSQTNHIKAMSRFDEQDRRLVIREVQERRDRRLSTVGRYRKLLNDDRETYYCVLGGQKGYFGISEGIIEEIEKNALRARLYIGVKMKDRIEVYSDNFSPILENMDELIYTDEGDYQFHTSRNDGQVCIREVDGWCLNMSFDVSLATDKFDELRSKIGQLSKDEQEELLERLREKRDDE